MKNPLKTVLLACFLSLFCLFSTGCPEKGEIDGPTYQKLPPEWQKQYKPGGEMGHWVPNPDVPKSLAENEQHKTNQDEIRYGHWEDWGALLILAGIIFVLGARLIDKFLDIDIPPGWGLVPIVGGMGLSVWAWISGQVSIFMNTFGPWVVGGFFGILAFALVMAIIEIVKYHNLPPKGFWTLFFRQKDVKPQT